MHSEETVPVLNRNLSLRRIVRYLVPLLVLCSLAAGILFPALQSRHQAQLQTDPNVATVWLAGVTRGPNHFLTRGASLQKWLNTHHVHVFGDYTVLQSRYQGDPGGIELWFDYDSYLPSHELECHRVGETAFVDDLGQPYHGYLDFQKKLIGVYMPGYDHSAHRLICTVHWVPRQPAPPQPVSRPMVFTVDLPPTPRQLPPASTLPPGPVTATKNGITVTVSEVKLGVPIVQPGNLTQRKLTFRLKIQGGALANSNASDAYLEYAASSPPNGLVFGSNLLRQIGAPRTLVAGNGLLRRWIGQPNSSALYAYAASPETSLTLTDPYGISLLPTTEYLTPLVTRDTLKEYRAGKGTVWVASVNGAGKGTDVIRLHCDILPTQSASNAGKPAATVPFDLLLPVEINNEPGR